MNRIILIGNGFDLAHNLKTKYENFIDWYWDKRVRNLCNEHSDTSSDELCILKNRSGVWSGWAYANSLNTVKDGTGKDIINRMKDLGYVSITCFSLFENIRKSVETKGWVDIENEYYNLLISYAINKKDKSYTDRNLNGQLKCVQENLIDYLSSLEIGNAVAIPAIRNKIYSPINPNDISVAGRAALFDYFKQCLEVSESEWYAIKQKYGLGPSYDYSSIATTKEEYKSHENDFDFFSDKQNWQYCLFPKDIMFLDFNYTGMADHYIKKDGDFHHNHIHGEVTHQDSIIFGYGDELDDNYKELVKLNENEYLKNVKSIRYLESDNYRKMLSFIESAPYQIFIMGHSCGNSDRTLLNTLFEHENCVSIKPFYYQKEGGGDNYMELVQNISRNFTDMKLMRDRVVNKTYCETLA